MDGVAELSLSLQDRCDAQRLEIAALNGVLDAAEHALEALEHPRRVDRQDAIDHLYGAISAVKLLRAQHGHSGA